MPVSPEPSTRPAPRRRVGWLRLSKDSDTRSIQIGVIGTILVHVLLLWLTPQLERRFASTALVSPSGAATPPSFNIEISPDSFTQEPQTPPPMKFVETNPDAPDNPPDQTKNFGAQNQQVAQETPDPDGKNEAPSVKGQTEIDSTAIVSGSRATEESEPSPPVPPSPEEAKAVNEALQEAARMAQDPLPGQEKVEGKDDDGIGSNIVPLPRNPQPIPERIEGVENSRVTQGASRGGQFRVDPSKPAPRPSLSANQVRPAFLTERVDGTSNMGVIAHNALRTEYGAYLARIIDAVDTQWDKNIRAKLQNGVSYPLSDSKVMVKFRLNKDGDVTIENVDGSADTVWSRVCVDAIAQRAPYGAWTSDMIAILGESTEITFTFHYQ